MWFPDIPHDPTWSIAVAHLTRSDRKLARAIAAVGPCTLARRRDYFIVLCKAVYSQQISTAVAAVLFGRFQALFPRRRPTPGLVKAALTGGVPDDALRVCGLSRQKKSYLIDLSDHFLNNRIPSRRLATMPDEDVIEALVAVKGVGRWTAEMFLMFVLNRPDVLPVDDLGLQTSVRDLYGLKDRPKANALKKLAEPWRPYRTVATWYLWRYSEKTALAAKKAALEAKQAKLTVSK